MAGWKDLEEALPLETGDVKDKKNDIDRLCLRVLKTKDGKEMMEWLHLAAAIHVPACKPYVYAHKMAKMLKKTDSEQQKYDSLQKNEELKSFHAKHAGDNDFSTSDLDKATAILSACFSKLEAALDGRKWIMGEQYTLADISWIPLHFVLIGCGYPFENYSNITRWANDFRAKKSFQEGVLKWCPDFSKV